MSLHVCFSLFAVVLWVGDREYRVKGRFHLRDPWWKITCTVQNHFVKGYPSYGLCTDLRSDGRDIVSLFLKACKASPESVKPFMDWVSKNNYEEPVTVINVVDALEAFGSMRRYKAIAKELKAHVQHSGEIITIL